MTKILSILLFACCGWSAEGTYRISGAVVNSVTGRMLDRVKVSLAPSTDPRRAMFTTTGSDGRFAFENLSAGKWSLNVRRAGYLTQSFGQPSTLAMPGVAVVTGPAEQTEALVLRMHPAGMITGKVTDSFGDPVRNALVQVYASGVFGGRRRVVPARSGWTFDDGSYAIGSLPAGAYFIAVTGEPWRAARNAGREAFAPQFYPGTTNSRSAAPIRLQSGEEVTADIVLTAAPSVNVTLKSPHAVRIQITSEGVGGSTIVHRAPTSPSSSETFSLVPGRYTVLFGAGAESIQRQTIEVGNQDAALELTPDAPATVHVVTRIVGSLREDADKLAVVLVSEDGTRGTPRMMTRDGVLKYPPVPAGSYVLRLVGPGAQDLAITDVSVEGARYEKGVLQVDSGAAARLHMSISGELGRIEGIVYRDGRPFPGALVVLARKESEDRRDLQGFVSDSDGSFEFRAVSAGHWSIFALEDGSDFAYADPAAVKPHLVSATAVQVQPTRVTNLKIELPSQKDR